MFISLVRIVVVPYVSPTVVLVATYLPVWWVNSSVWFLFIFVTMWRKICAPAMEARGVDHPGAGVTGGYEPSSAP